MILSIIGREKKEKHICSLLFVIVSDMLKGKKKAVNIWRFSVLSASRALEKKCDVRPMKQMVH